jgi:hypothetical protein
MALEDTAKNLMLDALGVDVTHISAHSAFPATLGNEATGGGAPAYARKDATWDSASGGAMALGTVFPVFDIESGDTVSALGLADALSAGVIQGGADVTDEAFGAQGTYTITALTVTIT